jgi:hypothetical protein
MSLSYAMRFKYFMHFKRKPEKRANMILNWLGSVTGRLEVTYEQEHC